MASDVPNDANQQALNTGSGVTPTRKSARKPQPSKRLSDFQILARAEGLGGQAGDDDDDEYAFLDAQVDATADVEDDEDFDIDVAQEHEPHDDDDGDESMIDADADASDSVNDAASNVDDDGSMIDMPLKKPKNKRQRIQTGSPSKRGPTKPWGRTQVNKPMSNSKAALHMSLFGPATEDQEPSLRAGYRWRREVTIPSRRADLSGAGGYHRTFYQADADRKREMDQDWKWWDEQGGRQYFLAEQKSEEIDAVAAQDFVRASPLALKVVAGPVREQKCYDVQPLTSMHLDHPFVAGNASNRARHPRSGWYLNVGGRVQTLAWAPNQGPAHYLAVCILHHQKSDLKSEPHSAFVPQSPVKSALQIWHFAADVNGYIDHMRAPQLCQVLCADFGDLRSVKWCPAPRRFEAERQGRKRLGLLASVWADGSVRALDVAVPSPGHDTQYIQIKQTAFSARPTEGVFTCVTWLSSHGLAAGTATGDVAILNIPTSCTQQSPSASANPVIVGSVQSTYITSIQSCYPSRPQMLMTSSMSGQLSLTDLSRVSVYPGFGPNNTVYSLRNRAGRPRLVWHDYSQMALTVDDNHILHGTPVRRFYSTTRLSRMGSGNTSIAASECHPCIAFGTTGGDVTFSNPMARGVHHKGAMYNLRWFLHTWRPAIRPRVTLPFEKVDAARAGAVAIQAAANQDDSSVIAEPDIRRAQDVDMQDADEADVRAANPDHTGQMPTSSDITEKHDGLVQIVEGFKAEHIYFETGGGTKLKTKGATSNSALTTIYEPQTAVTALAWNPNLHVGGWIAAGMGSGLVRVEDVGTDK